jgi:predicted branched-subunit amino acid permease
MSKCVRTHESFAQQLSFLAVCNVQQIPTGTQLVRGEAWAIGLTYFTVAITVSIVHRTAGTDPWLIVAAALIVNSATATLAFASATASGGSAVTGVLSSWIVSTRFGLLAATIAPRLWSSRKKRLFAAYSCFDPNVALALREEEDSNLQRVYVSLSLWLIIPWWLGSVVGVLVGNIISDPLALGLDVMFPALFVALLWRQLDHRLSKIVGLAGAAIALGTVEFIPGGLPILLAAFTALLGFRKKNTRPKELH